MTWFLYCWWEEELQWRGADSVLHTYDWYMRPIIWGGLNSREVWKDYRCSTRDESDDFLFVKLFIVPYRILISTIIFQVLDSKYSMYLSLKCSTFYLPTSKSTLPVDRLRPWPVRKACRLRAFSDSFVAFQLLQVASNELFLFSFLFFFFFSFSFSFSFPPPPSLFCQLFVVG